MLDNEGDSFEGLKPWLDHQYDGMTTEEVYDELIKRRDQELEDLVKQFGKKLWGYKDEETGQGDRVTSSKPENQEDATVDRAHDHQQRGLSCTRSYDGGWRRGHARGGPDNPKAVPIAQAALGTDPAPVLQRAGQRGLQLARPNRRYQDIYLPRCRTIVRAWITSPAFEDVSGSISDADSIRFNSEFKYVKDTFQPEKMTLLQFDTIIQKEDVFLKDDPFEEIQIIGRGGTSLVCVRDWIIENEPTAVVIFGICSAR